MFGDDKNELVLFHLTLQRQTNFVCSCTGHFVEINGDNNKQDSNGGNINRRKHLQLCISTQTHLELYDVSEASLKRLAIVPIFATVTAMETLNLEHCAHSFLVITSDSGNLTICKFSIENQRVHLRTLINQPLTRSGLRRLSPISHLQVDLHGRCLFLSAIERNQLCFVVNQVGQDNLCIQDPLEALIPNTLMLDTTVCDVRYDNPCFSAVELQRGSCHLVFYVLDLGLNHIVKRADYEVENSANFLMGLPDLSRYHISTYMDCGGPGAYDEINPFVLVGFEDFVTIRDMRGFYDIKVQIPMRSGASTSTWIISSTMQTLKKDFFVLLQSNHGDLFKLKILPNSKDSNRPMAIISYFDTIPQTTALHIFKNGLLFANADVYDSRLFQFESLGDDSSVKMARFDPSETLRNLSLIDSKKNLNPLISSEMIKTSPLTIATNSKNKPMYVVNGIDFERQVTSPVHNAKDIWSVKFPGDTYHRSLFLAFHESTMILETHAGSLQELTQERHDFKTKSDQTIFVGSMGSRSVIQVCMNELRQVVFNKDSKKYEKKLEWFPPAGIRLVAADCTSSQLAVGLSNGEVCYFEINSSSPSDSLHELQNRIEIDGSIKSLSLVPGLRSDFLAIGTRDANLKVLSLKQEDMENFLEVVSLQALMAPVNDLKITRTERDVQIHVGLVNGLYSRLKLNKYDGRLYDVRTKFLGPKQVSLSVLPSISFLKLSEEEEEEGEEDSDDPDNAGEVTQGNEEGSGGQGPCVLLHSLNTWASYQYDSLLYIRPVFVRNGGRFVRICSFCTENLKNNGCCALDINTSSGYLTIGLLQNFISNNKWFQMKDMSEWFAGDAEEDYEEETENKISPRLYEVREIIAFGDNKRLILFIENSSNGDHAKVSLASWQKRFILRRSKSKFQLLEKMRVLTATIVKFSTSTYYLVISTASKKLCTFELIIEEIPEGKHISDSEGTFELRFLHSTQIEDQVYSMIQFRDQLLIPMFGSLILYGLGKNQLLKRSVSLTTASITKISALDNWKNKRIAVGDTRESVTLLQFDSMNNIFVPVADDIVKRHVTTLTFIDQSTVIGGDKFGNIWTLRLSREQESLIRSNFPHSMHKLQQYPELRNRAPNIMECPLKFSLTNHFYVNDIPMKFHVAESVQLSDRPLIIYCGLQGTIGALVPLLTKSEIDNLKALEKAVGDADDLFYLEQESGDNVTTSGTVDDDGLDKDIARPLGPMNVEQIPEGAYSIVGRDWLKYRGYYAPVRNVIDGDLCEIFFSLTSSEQSRLCKEMDGRRPDDIFKQLTEIRTNYL